MKIYINNKELEVSGNEPLIEELNRNGYNIPSLCYAKGAKHQASCMVCMVKNIANGQMIPSCSTFPTEGMKIETDTEEVLSLRQMSLELLLSDHRADCEAPCTIVCPNKLDPAQILLYYDKTHPCPPYEGGSSHAEKDTPNTNKDLRESFPCYNCKAPCEKACRRGTVDKSVSIREIMIEMAENHPVLFENTPNGNSLPHREGRGGSVFSSKLGRYTNEEKEWLKEVYNDASHCLHCACEGRDKCKLREYSAQAGIKAPRYGVSSSLPVKEQIRVVGKLCYEPAKCIRCGLCVYNSEDGFTFHNRGFVMQVVIPEESKNHIKEQLATLCPTGALFLAP